MSLTPESRSVEAGSESVLKPYPNGSGREFTSIPAFWQKWRMTERIKAFWQENQEPVSIWFGLRMVMLALPIFVGLLIPPGRWLGLNAYYYSNPWQDALLGSWLRWDGDWYLRIAGQGYYDAMSVAFYPLYPHLIRWVGFVIGLGKYSVGAINLAGILVSSISTLLACIFLYRLIRLDHKDPEVAHLTVLYLMTFPAAFFLFAVYTEGLFLALAVGAFYAARRNQWLIALLIASLAVLTKNQGIWVAAALFFEYGRQIGWRPSRLDRRLLYFGFPAAALGGWLAFNVIAFRSPVQFLDANRYFWFRYFDWPWNVLRDSFKFSTRGDIGGGIAGIDSTEAALKASVARNSQAAWQLLPPEYTQTNTTFIDLIIAVVFILLAGVAVYYTWKKGFSLGYLVFFLGCLFQPMLLPRLNMPLIGMPRYAVVIFPAFYLLALAGRRWRWFHYTYLAFSLPLLGLLTARFCLWYWVA